MKTYLIREVVHYHIQADSAEEAEEQFLEGNMGDCSIEEREVTEISE